MNAADAFDIGSFDEEDTKGIKVKQAYASRVLHLSAALPCTTDAVCAAPVSCRQTRPASKAPHTRCDFLKWKGSFPRRGHVSAGDGTGVQGNL